MRRRLTVVSTVEEQVARELVGRDELRSTRTGHVPEYTVRVNFHCNQACEFCFVSTHLPPPAEAAVRAGDRDAPAAKARSLVLSGGEPTLNSRLVEYVQLAKHHGARAVELQTNAIRLADPALTRALAAAGLDRAMVSLHGSTAEISDAITGAPGTFAATVRGIDELAQTLGARPAQLRLLPGQPRRLPPLRRLRRGALAAGRRSSSPSSARTPTSSRAPPSLIPRFTRRHAVAARRPGAGAQRGLDVSGFDSMCGLPLCLVPEAERGQLLERSPWRPAAPASSSRATCARDCAEGHRCYGVRRGYAELYGTAELRPLSRDAGASAAQ